MAILEVAVEYGLFCLFEGLFSPYFTATYDGEFWTLGIIVVLH